MAWNLQPAAFVLLKIMQIQYSLEEVCTWYRIASKYLMPSGWYKGDFVECALALQLNQRMDYRKQGSNLRFQILSPMLPLCDYFVTGCHGSEIYSAQLRFCTHFIIKYKENLNDIRAELPLLPQNVAAAFFVPLIPCHWELDGAMRKVHLYRRTWRTIPVLSKIHLIPFLLWFKSF